MFLIIVFTSNMLFIFSKIYQIYSINTIFIMIKLLKKIFNL